MWMGALLWIFAASPYSVIPAQTGIRSSIEFLLNGKPGWIPAFAGMTEREMSAERSAIAARIGRCGTF